MNSTTLTVHWHDENQPVYLVEFQRNQLGVSGRLVTAGGDNNVRIWRVHPDGGAGGDGLPSEPSVEYLSTLSKHTQAVNVARYDAQGTVLATAGDDGTLIFWTKSDTLVKEFGAEDDDASELWTARHICRLSTSEIYDIAWSPDLQYVAAGSMDNVVRIYRASDGAQMGAISEHSHYVQGVAWDPLGEYLATQLADRSVHVHALTHLQPFSLRVVQKLSRAEIPAVKGGPGGLQGTRLMQLYHSETLQSFFRRLAFSPDGSLLVAPLGIQTRLREERERDVGVDLGESKNAAQALEKEENSCGSQKKENEAVAVSEDGDGGESKDARNTNETGDKDAKETRDDDTDNTVYVYTRAGLRRGPVCQLPGLKKPAIAVRFCPVLFERLSKTAVFELPYRMVFAVATQDSVVLYDTEQQEPLGMVSNLHYLTITDLCWNCDGRNIVVSLADGFCSLVTLQHNWEVYKKAKEDNEKSVLGLGEVNMVVVE